MLPESYRFGKKDTFSKRRGLNLRRSIPKPIQPLTYTPPTNNPNSHVNKDELLNSFPILSLPVNSFPLTDLKESLIVEQLKVQSAKDAILALYFRFFPEHTRFQRYEFLMSNSAKKMLMFKGGLHHCLDVLTRTPYKKVIEFITYYKGMYGRLIIFVSLGIGCTVWYNFIPGVPEVAPPGILVPRELPYDSFKDVSFDIAPFMKMSYVEYKYISDQVLSAFDNVYPFNEIHLPSGNTAEGSNARVALGLGIIVAAFLGMGMMSYSSPPDLELISTLKVQELQEIIVKR
ncbi:unnamed protein product [Lactuca saligna]|uniref:Uncharacterized protein n=1 Tax=Lactuca saligna TaxID=75948 RepID=A0AA35Y1D1_LACSI|nr:unnamed protein product [Lactuca saligna]